MLYDPKFYMNSEQTILCYRLTFISMSFGRAVIAKTKKSTPIKGKTIVQILPRLNRGGVERGTLEIAQAIINAGGNAVVISAGGILEGRLKYIGAKHIKLSVHTKNPFRWMLVRHKVKAALKDVGADIVHVRSRAPAWIALKAAKSLGIKTVSTIHGHFKAEQIFKRYYNSIMTRSDRIITVSNYVFERLVGQFPEVKNKTKTIHRGVDLEKFDRAAVTKQRLVTMADMLALPDDGMPTVMLPARPTSCKGALVLIEALGMIKEKPFMLTLIGAGDGDADFQKTLIKHIEAAKLASRARIYPSVDDMPAALMLADVVAMPSSLPEAFGRVAVEAAAMGRPVVAFNHGGAKESIIDGVTGWLADPIDAAALSQCLIKALSQNKIERQKMAEAARELMEKKFSAEKMCRATLSVYAGLLNS